MAPRGSSSRWQRKPLPGEPNRSFTTERGTYRSTQPGIKVKLWGFGLHGSPWRSDRSERRRTPSGAPTLHAPSYTRNTQDQTQQLFNPQNKELDLTNDASLVVSSKFIGTGGFYSWFKPDLHLQSPPDSPFHSSSFLPPTPSSSSSSSLSSPVMLIWTNPEGELGQSVFVRKLGSFVLSLDTRVEACRRGSASWRSGKR